MATLEIGQRREDLTVILVQDDDLIESIRLQAGRNNPDGLAEGTPIDWPAGTAAWLEIRNKGSQTDGRIPGHRCRNRAESCTAPTPSSG